MTTVSVIMPYLDAAASLREAVASVRAQSLADWELLLVDDGSTDGSPEIAAYAAAADPRMRLVARSDRTTRGAAAARNTGLRAATGRFVAFLDADDLYEVNQLETLVSALEEHADIAFTYGPTRWWHPSEPGRDWVESMGDLARRVHDPPDLLTRVIVQQQGEVPCTCAVAARRDAVLDVGGFEESFQLYEDQTLWVKLLLRHRAYVGDVVGARYRQHDRSTSALAARQGSYDRWNHHAARGRFLRWIDEHRRASGLANRPLERALRRSLAPYRGERQG
jgi:glycosyltransferase involved in cell wall biosynthesis